MRLCSIDSCGRVHRAKGLCSSHYMRVDRTGSAKPDQPVAKINARGNGNVSSTTGYKRLHYAWHPLAGKDGLVYGHRMALYDVIGYGPHRCHHCGRHVNWKHAKPDRLDVDHLDFDRLNNSPDNLVASCSVCNFSRQSRRAT